MSRLSTHLPKAGALALSILVAAVAYSVYAESHSTSSTGTRPPAAARTLDFSGSALPGASEVPDQKPLARPKPSAGDRSPEDPSPSPLGTAAQVEAAYAEAEPQVLAPTPVAAPLASPVSPIAHADPPRRSVRPPRQSPRPGGFDERSINRELQRLIGDGTVPRPVQRPIGGDVAPKAPKRRAPVADAPVDGAPSGSPPGAPVESPPAVAPGPGAGDPEAALDDTAVGGLDQTDLGGPVDETDGAAADVPPPAGPEETAPVLPLDEEPPTAQAPVAEEVAPDTAETPPAAAEPVPAAAEPVPAAPQPPSVSSQPPPAPTDPAPAAVNPDG
jgi:hypothetical protein